MRSIGLMLWKELTQVSNRARFAFQKTAVAASVCFPFVYFSWASLYGGGRGASFESVSLFARRFSSVWGLLSALILSAAALIFSGAIVVEERTKKRLPLLVIAHVSPACIIGAKAVSVFARIAVGLLAALPVLVMLAAFGGVEPKALVFLAAIVLSNAWLYGGIGLLASSRAPTLLWTIAFASGAAIVWNVALNIARHSGLAGIAEFAGILSVPEVVEHMLYAGTGWFSMAGVHIAANFCLGTLLVIAAAIVFRFTAAMERRRRETPAEIAGTAGADKRREHRAAGFGRGILAKEIVSRRIVFTLLPLVLFVLIWVTALFNPYSGAYRYEYLFRSEQQCRILAWEAAALFWIMSLRAAVFVSSEKERGTVELLLLSRLGMVRTLAGKAAAALVEQIPGFFILTLHMLFFLSSCVRHREDLWLLPPAFALAAVFSTALGLYFGLAAKHVVTAVSLTAFTWFFGATAGPAVAAVTRAATAAGKVAPVLPLLFIAGGLGAAATVLFFARRGGYGSWLPAVAYSIIAGGIILGSYTRFVSATIDAWQAYHLLERTWMLPVANLFGFSLVWFGAPEIAVVSCAQIGLLAWMIISGILGFEAQAKRA